MTKAVCVCSGGLDSTVAATIAKKKKRELYIFHTNYRHRAEKRERKAVEKIAKFLRAKEIKFVNVDFLGNLGSSALTDKSIKVPQRKDVKMELGSTPSTWVPCRNLVLLSLASAWVEVLGAEEIYTGFNAEEAMSYPDNTPDFVSSFNETLKNAVASFSAPPKVIAPLADLQKKDIVALGVRYGAPLHLTWSCYFGRQRHCGVCESCIHRRNGFKEAGVVDPTEYERI
jgi:7-cyano-7-deazaguanine synthase